MEHGTEHPALTAHVDNLRAVKNYDRILRAGFKIDVRGIYPVLMLGKRTWECANYERAIEFACAMLEAKRLMN
jgi:hypothetical protein